MATTVLRCNLRLSDVHATADAVGQQFRKLTDRFGTECFAQLVPPVVQSLEWLEAYVESHQHLQTTVSELEMENDTLEYEREQRALLAEKNESLMTTIRELQKENRCLLMEMDDLHFKNQELSTLLEKTSRLAKHTATDTESVEETSSPVLAPSSPPPHSPNRVVHLSQIYPSTHSSHSPNFTPSPPPTLPTSLFSSSADSTPTPTPLPSQSHTSPASPPSPDSQDTLPSPHTFPVSPLLSPTLHHCHQKHHPHTPPATRAHMVLPPVGRSSSLSDMAKVRIQNFPLSRHPRDEEDMFERSRVTRRLSKVEANLEMTTQQLGDLQRSRERFMDENKQLKLQVEKLKAEVSLESIVSNHEEGPVEEAPRYYKKDVLQVLTERNQLKEQLHSLQEELDQLRDTLRKTATGTRSRRGSRPVLNGMTRISNGGQGARRTNSVRSILTESIRLDSYHAFQPSTSGSPQKTTHS